MVYEMPKNITGLTGLFKWANGTVDFFGLGLLIMIFGITFIATIKFQAKRAFAVSSWLTFLSAFLLFGMGIVSAREVTITAVLVGISVIVLWFSKD